MGSSVPNMMFLIATRGARLRFAETVAVTLVVAAVATLSTVVFGYTDRVVAATAARVRPPSGECRDCGDYMDGQLGAGIRLARTTTWVALGGWHGVLWFLPLLGAAAMASIVTASLLGRKRTLGLIRAVGGTAADLQKMFLWQTALAGVPGLVAGLCSGQLIVKLAWGTWAGSLRCLAGSAGATVTAMVLGSIVPILLLRNATTDQLLANRPVYVIPNPSCSKCGACGGV